MISFHRKIDAFELNKMMSLHAVKKRRKKEIRELR